MQIFSSIQTMLETLEVSFFLSLRYLLFAGTLFLIFYIWKKKNYWYLKIQQQFPDKQHVLREIKYSFFTVIIFGIIIIEVMWASKNRYTLVYYPIDKYGWPYYFFSIILMIFVHDAYFYWTHRMLHWKPLFKWAHKVHHFSHNPTPFSAYAFHPFEALVEISIIPLLVFTIPYHVSAISAFSIYTLLLNVGGHMGFEFFPKGFATHKWFKWHNTATHHNMHHRYIKYNYGLYFNFWDRIMKTNHPKYEETFDEVIEQREKVKAATAAGQLLNKPDTVKPALNNFTDS